MNISKSKESQIINKESIDPLDTVIFGKGVRIHNLYIDYEYKLMIVLLNTGKAFKFSYKRFPNLAAANQTQLNDFKLIGGGVGIHWSNINEDLSLKGIIKEAVLAETLNRLQSEDTSEMVIF